MKKFFTLISICFSVFFAYASDGTLDTATFNPPNGFQNNPAGFGLSGAVQVDGKIVAVGFNGTDLQIARYNADGSIDGTFIPTPVPNTGGNDVIIQPDGKILVAGNIIPTTGRLVRYLPNGDLDPDFGTGGIVDVPSIAFFNTVTLQADGKIVAVGSSMDPGFGQAVRLFPDGSPDITFDPVPANGNGFCGIVIQADGKIVTASATIDNKLQVIRYTAAGTLDTTFNGTGIATVPIDPIVFSTGVLLQPSDEPSQLLGKILVIGQGSNSAYEARYNNDGTLDSSFASGTGGIFTFPNIILNFNGAVLQADYKTVIIGGNVTSTKFAVIRVTENGQLDTSWNGGTGIISEPDGTGIANTIQSDGKIIGVGFNAGNFMVARYNSSPTFTPTTITAPTPNGTAIQGPITFSGTAQNPAVIYLFIDGILVGGTYSDPGTANTWQLTTNITTLGTHTAQVVSIYQDKKLNLASEIITFTVIEPPPPVPPICQLPPLTNTSELVRSIILKYCCR